MNKNSGNTTIFMPPDHSPDRVEQPRPEYMIVKLEAILEPELAARSTMDDDKMRELIESLDQIGQRDPIQLMRKGDMFELVDGHRRFLAARSLNQHYVSKGEVRWTCLRAEVYPEGDPNMLAARLHANIIREQLNPAEEGIFMRQAMEQYGLDLAGLCKLFHRSEAYVDARFKLVYGPPEVLQAVLDNKVNMSAAHQLNRIKDEKFRKHYLDCAINTNPPGSVVKTWVAEWEKMQPYLNHSTMGPAPAVEEQPIPEAPRRACAFCGGHLDQGNLIEVTVHKFEWERFLSELRKLQGA